MVNNLDKMSFRDTGCLSNVYIFEKNYIITLAMYYKMGRYNPSDRFIQTYRNKDILRLYKMISEEKLDMNRASYKIYGYIHNINERVKTNIHK